MRIGHRGEERPAVLLPNDTVVDVSDHVPDYDGAFFSGGGPERLSRLLEEQAAQLPLVELGSVRVGAPIARPHQIVCIGLNYSDHAEEAGMALPDEPILFNKAPNTLVGPDDPVLIPPGSTKTDWEVELGIVMGSSGRYLPHEDAAREAIAGYCVVNDVSERAYQLERGGQWVKGKSCETFNPAGPWLVTADEIADVQDLDMRLSVNGVPAQTGNTKTMVFSATYLVWYVSQFMVLEPGDLINTGTPPGVGMAMSPPHYLSVGDVMDVEIERLGRQRQICASAEP